MMSFIYRNCAFFFENSKLTSAPAKILSVNMHKHFTSKQTVLFEIEKYSKLEKDRWQVDVVGCGTGSGRKVVRTEEPEEQQMGMK